MVSFPEDSTLVDADFSGANLRDADLSKADLRDAVLSGADLWGAVLSGADLRDADLSEEILQDVDLSGADLRRADLSKADLRGVILSRATLRDADLSEANLENADLSRAEFRGAILSGADLSGADLSAVSLNQGTRVEGFCSRPDSPEEWDRLARAYHELKTECSSNGLMKRPGRYVRWSVGPGRERPWPAETFLLSSGGCSLGFSPGMARGFRTSFCGPSQCWFSRHSGTAGSSRPTPGKEVRCIIASSRSLHRRLTPRRRLLE